MNKVFMIGNLTKDPDLRSTGNGVSVCSFRIAVNRRFPNQAGERVSDFFDVVAWRQLADGGEGGFGGGYGGGRHQAPAAPAADGFADIEDDELPF